MASPDWSSLPSDLVRRVADLFLANSDLDYYMSLRGVCCNWRAATADPRGPDRRFSPRGWVLVASLTGDDHRCLFLHVDTGRLLWKDLPMLRNYTCAASAEGGHLVLEPASRASRMCLLHPITGHLVRFPITRAQFLGKDKEIGLEHGRSMFAAGSSPMVLYSRFDLRFGGCIDHAVFNRESLFRAAPALGSIAAMVPFKGRAYVVYKSGSVAVVEHNCRLDEKPVVTAVLTTVVDDPNGCVWSWLQDCCSTFLVDNAGELLLVRLLALDSDLGDLQVFRLDIQNNRAYLEQITSIGNRAVFLGEQRCLSVDARNLPAVECDCVYYVSGGSMCMLRLDDGRSRVEQLEPCYLQEEDQVAHKQFPKTLARLLMEYACCKHYAPVQCCICMTIL